VIDVGMATLATVAFYSTSEKEPRVFHDNLLCEDGARIEGRYLAFGTDRRPRCSQCQWLADLGK